MSQVDRLVEDTVGKLPLGNEPAGRALWGGGITAALIFGLKPNAFYYPKYDKNVKHADRKLKDWIFFKSKNTSKPDDAFTIFPWWMAVSIPALVLGLFV